MARAALQVSGSRFAVQQEAPLYVNVLKTRNSILAMPTDQGGGIHNGEKHEYDLSVLGGARLAWKPAGATLARAGQSGAAGTGGIRQTIFVEDSELCFLNRPVIVCEASRMSLITRLQINGRGRASYVEIAGSGRSAMGEHWRFASFSNQLDVILNERLVYREKWDLARDRFPHSAAGFRNCRLFASAVFCGADAQTRAEALSTFWRNGGSENLFCESAAVADNCWLVKCLDVDGLSLNRMLGEKIWDRPSSDYPYLS